jgi:protein-S-isoprenylcysteine O-methyltransferase Ste14
MYQGLRFYFLSLYAIGPVISLVVLLRRGLKPSTAQYKVKDWRRYIPTVLLPFEWLLPPALILLGFGEVRAEWLPARLSGCAVSACGIALLVWASVSLGRFLVHGAAVFEDHTLVTSGPYHFVRHPIYLGYLALLLGSVLGTLNVCLFLLWPLSLLGIVFQADAEEQLLDAKFTDAYQSYAERSGRFIPRLRNGGG